VSYVGLFCVICRALLRHTLGSFGGYVKGFILEYVISSSASYVGLFCVICRALLRHM